VISYVAKGQQCLAEFLVSESSFLVAGAAGLCDLELLGVTEAGDRDPAVLGEALPTGLRAPGGVLRPAEQEIWWTTGVSLPVCGERGIFVFGGAWCDGLFKMSSADDALAIPSVSVTIR